MHPLRQGVGMTTCSTCYARLTAKLDELEAQHEKLSDALAMTGDGISGGRTAKREYWKIVDARHVVEDDLLVYRQALAGQGLLACRHEEAQ